ncbi:helix-turn-helix domain-containing protein [Streptomyces sp. NPDC054854]
MTEQQRGRRAIEVGPTGTTVGLNLGRLRKRHGLTTRQLSGALERAGRYIPASGITRMEKGERSVTVDDLAALCRVLGVSPSALLLPLTSQPTDSVEVTGAGSVSAVDAWQWANGERPLSLTSGKEREELVEHRLYGLPLWLWPQSGNEDASMMRARLLAAGLSVDDLYGDMGMIERPGAGGDDG